ncbi:MAG TPA: hypothetical protein VI894_01945 [Candidatus Nanoarchaeia archaeon]|nr:hypothetical protein [Candidatus Nanoarchaeia archaeon]
MEGNGIEDLMQDGKETAMKLKANLDKLLEKPEHFGSYSKTFAENGKLFAEYLDRVYANYHHSLIEGLITPQEIGKYKKRIMMIIENVFTCALENVKEIEETEK